MWKYNIGTILNSEVYGRIEVIILDFINGVEVYTVELLDMGNVSWDNISEAELDRKIKLG